MAGIFGIIAVALGICLLWLWWPAVWALLQALVALSLLFWGVIAVLVQHSKNKARLDRERARHDALSLAPLATDAQTGELSDPVRLNSEDNESLPLKS